MKSYDEIEEALVGGFNNFMNKHHKRVYLSLATFLLVIAVSAACSPKDQVRYQRDTIKIDVGVVPADVCRIDGMPKVLSINMDEGDLSLIYIRNNGDVVMHHWFAYGTTFKEGGEFFWHGGTCPGSTATPTTSQPSVTPAPTQAPIFVPTAAPSETPLG